MNIHSGIIPSSTHDQMHRTQVAALCFRASGGQPEILLVTTLGSGRWILPKGWPMKSVSPAGVAQREAWEEAGVIGTPHGFCLGTISYTKILAGAGRQRCSALVYPVEVRSLADDYPEKGRRKRRWFTALQAASVVEEPELAGIIRNFDRAFRRRGSLSLDIGASLDM